MPYIPKERRLLLEPYVIKLSESLKDSGAAGDINYVISAILWKLWEEKPSYTLGNTIMGVLASVSAEFYRRKLAVYEDEAINTNGDL